MCRALGILQTQIEPQQVFRSERDISGADLDPVRGARQLHL
jgi:hypothetical protein